MVECHPDGSTSWRTFLVKSDEDSSEKPPHKKPNFEEMQIFDGMEFSKGRNKDGAVDRTKKSERKTVDDGPKTEADEPKTAADKLVSQVQKAMH